MGGELETLIRFGLTILAGSVMGVICVWSIIRIGKGERDDRKSLDD